MVSLVTSNIHPEIRFDTTYSRFAFLTSDLSSQDILMAFSHVICSFWAVDELNQMNVSFFKKIFVDLHDIIYLWLHSVTGVYK